MSWKTQTRIVFSLLLVAMLSGCFATENLVHVPRHDNMTSVDDYDLRLYRQSQHIFNPMPIDARVMQLRLQPRVEHLVFLVDQSASLNDSAQGLDTRFYAKEVVRRFVKTMPTQPISSTIVTYNNEPALQLYAPLDARLTIATRFPNELEFLLSGHRTAQHIQVKSLSVAIDFVSELVGNLPGPSAVVLVTEWAQIDESVELAVMRMRQRTTFGRNAHVVVPEASAIAWPQSHSGLCFYTVGVGNRLSRSRLENADSCGFSSAVDKVAQPSNMANFVESVLFRGPADEDNDGIYDYQDLCPATPAHKIVDYRGCPRFQ
ncbi:VWA domain-containing protein [Aestuariibacter sp. GS-14]|uniref:vWA domain-containing protein n=1 Tax=Aestuariibacter sp. GS-14 TaxID=2590670 RepID=UPI00112B7829|nr:VWA domain-containing protein [Aestuariibacter sp. GS-14]TPV53676.1 VWA domain-containing protein [Aestuariibacter sp. GS-14]